MELRTMITPANLIAALLTLSPLVIAAFFPQSVTGRPRRLPVWAQLVSPAGLSVPYVLVACGGGVFRWGWFALYAVLPVAVASLLWQAGRADPGIQPPQRQMPVAGDPGQPPQRQTPVAGDPGVQPPQGQMPVAGEPDLSPQRQMPVAGDPGQPPQRQMPVAGDPGQPPQRQTPVAGDPGVQRGNWRDFLVLAVLGLAVDLRWFEGAWPAHLAIFSKMLLLDAGIYGFIAVRQLEGIGFDLRLRLRDAAIGLREVALYMPLALALGLGLGFLHLHRGWPGLAPIAGAWVFTFFFIAVPEELFFRGWLQNLLERRMGRTPALFLTAVLFGLAHFNKRAVLFNWRYVLLAAVAGVFYGRAWRQQRRVGASAVTHATVDAIWSLWLR
jgi:membrane protease YdiL (CAAX protease family)